MHHRVPVSRGGEHFAQTNLEVLCRNCHIAVHRSQGTVRTPQRSAWDAAVRELLDDVELPKNPATNLGDSLQAE